MLNAVSRFFGFDAVPKVAPAARRKPAVPPAAVAAPPRVATKAVHPPFPISRAVRAMAYLAGQAVSTDGGILTGDTADRARRGLGQDLHSYVRALLLAGQPVPHTQLHREGQPEYEILFVENLRSDAVIDLDTWEKALLAIDRDRERARRSGRTPLEALYVPPVVAEGIAKRDAERIARLARRNSGTKDTGHGEGGGGSSAPPPPAPPSGGGPK